MKFLASEKLSEHRYKTPEGYLVCTDAILARTGKQTYRKNEIFDTQDDDEVEIDRPAEEVFNAQTVASFENKPVTVEHPAEDVNVSNYKEHAVGFARDIRRGTANGQDVLLGNLVITDGKTIEEIENGEHTELSCGYDCDVSEQDLVQRNIRGNHIALCDHGRAGIARIVDSEENRKAEDEDMVKHAVDKIGRKFTLEEKGGKIVATNESGRTKEYASWDEAEKEFSKRGIAIKDDFFGDELIESGSEEALRENIKTEIEAGKDPKQAAAIAYRVQRENDSSDKDVPNAKAHEPGMAAMDAEKVELYKVYVDEYGARPQDSYFYVEASDKNEAVRKVEKATQNKVISADVVIGWEARNARSDKNRYLDSEKKYEVHTRDKNGSCRVDIVRAKDYIDAVKKARNR